MGILKKALVFLGILVAILIVVGFLLPRKVHVERSVTIAAPRSTVFTIVNGFRLFRKWSPWEAVDPTMKVTIEGPEWGVGAKQSWVGDPKKVGSGSETITESVPYDSLTVALDFGDQGQPISRWTFTTEGDNTKVVWGMDADMGKGPVGRYFGLMMDKMVGNDFAKGLEGLKKLAEGMPKADFDDLKVEIVDTTAVPIAFASSTSGKGETEIAAAIGAAFGQVGRFMAAAKLKQAGPVMTINTKWDETGYAFEAAVPIDRMPEALPASAAPVGVKQSYAGRVLKVVHKGAYRTLQKDYDQLDAYAAAHGYERPAPTWDEYVTDPGKTPEPDLITNIYMPVK
ncbi:MAG TPA: SRPBCC family protein [Patescibacteria group bacterium]|nr:SRPBCC family protein [Patescibacteria group bacterium]